MSREDNVTSNNKLSFKRRVLDFLFKIPPVENRAFNSKLMLGYIKQKINVSDDRDFVIYQMCFLCIVVCPIIYLFILIQYISNEKLEFFTVVNLKELNKSFCIYSALIVSFFIVPLFAYKLRYNKISHNVTGINIFDKDANSKNGNLFVAGVVILFLPYKGLNYLIPDEMVNSAVIISIAYFLAHCFFVIPLGASMLFRSIFRKLLVYP